ncbi:DUF1385 domain-containing protein [Chloroflexota bacterium]
MTKKFYYGGQAVVEGVMMRGPKTLAIAVRRPNGEVSVQTQSLPTIYTGWLRKAPFIRGIIFMIENLALGIKTLLYSANVSLEEEEEEISGKLAWLVVFISVAFSVALFFLLPLFLTGLFKIESSILFNLVDGIIRVTIFVIYLAAMSLMPDIKRVFAYHGAEHKTVNAYEAGVPLEPEAIKGYGTAHVRCGTSFIFAVVIISIIVFSFVGLHTVWLMVLSRIVLIPVIAGIGYEFIYFSGRHQDIILVRITSAPGLWLQSLTTREPDEKQIEVAMSALRRVIEIEQPEEVTWQTEPDDTLVVVGSEETNIPEETEPTEEKPDSSTG